MAVVGTIEQYQGPFETGSTLGFEGYCILGVSIGEDDFMKLGSSSADRSFRFSINGNQIWMGRTYMYQTERQIEKDGGAVSTVIGFPDGAPASVKVEVVYCSASSYTS